MSENSKSIGETLRDARIAKGYTLDDLQQTTKIQKRYLIAIEDGQFSDLPGDFYVRAFIKQYAETVGLDGNELLDQFSDQLPSTKTQEYKDRVNEENPETRSAQRKVDDRTAKIRRQVPIVAAVVVVVAVLIGIWYASTKNSQQSSSSQNVDSSSVSVSGSSQKASSASSKASSKKAKKASSSASKASFSKVSTSGTTTTYDMTNAPKTKTVKLKSSASAWVSVTSNGSTVWQGTLTAGKTQSVKVSSSATSATFNLGNAPSTSITIGGKKLPISTTSTSSATTASSTTSDSTTTTTSSSTTTTSSQVQNITVQFK
ncbi:Xre-like DNA-binding protein [Secundilactobacillus odoratitofui DSM 19909 = JCM 15043]|uniref:Xre-like DNA-binding protein n=1 Tax=Secundilactobacillus odoratitofui DSM 19909 = JCM 15043 TaxID=1423776 RepID=A0A0R1LUL3_9LACO|nr:RodZ domain-containing protein [Secundilactobacillus odoratitofui]KRK99403.1 Xre-like DNA-binding protein [Secundilactobacillus odoratitofui DSM 19909 = JCM 15043]